MTNVIWDRITNIVIGWGAGIFMALAMDVWEEATWGWRIGLIAIAIAYGYLLMTTILDIKPLNWKTRKRGDSDVD